VFGGIAAGGRETAGGGAGAAATGEPVETVPYPVGIADVPAMPTALLTRSRKMVLSKGFCRKEFAPTLRERGSSKGSNVPASKMTGI
jgi:hypothetical protein